MTQPAQITVTPTTPIFAGREWLASGTRDHFLISDNTYHLSSGWHIHPDQLPSDVAVEVELLWTAEPDQHIYRVKTVDSVYSVLEEEPLLEPQKAAEIQEALSENYVSTVLALDSITSVKDVTRVVTELREEFVRDEVVYNFIHTVPEEPTLVYIQSEDYHVTDSEPKR